VRAQRAAGPAVAELGPGGFRHDDATRRRERDGTGGEADDRAEVVAVLRQQVARDRSPRGSSRTRSSATAHGREHRDLVAVAQHGLVAVLGLVAVHPDTRGREHLAEGGTVDGAGRGEQLTDRRRLERVLGATRGVTRLREESEPDRRQPISATPSLITASPSALVVSNA
jgi:hypothetical protein